MKNTLLSTIVFMKLLISTTSAQVAEPSISKVKINEKVPPYTLTNLINYPTPTVQLNKFKGKILILDFWTFGCSACIASWPKLMKLQEQFKDNIQIILVNIYDEKEKVADFLAKREKAFGYKMTLPVTCGDANLKTMFPHDVVPHVVWIDQLGTLKYISAGSYLDDRRIEMIIKGQDMNIPEKTDEPTAFRYNKPFFVGGNGGNEETGGKIIWSSMIKEYSPSIRSVTTFASRKDISFGIIGNNSVKDMLRVLFSTGLNENAIPLNFPPGRMVFRNIDTSKLVSKINGSYQHQNFYSIQVIAQRQVPITEIKKQIISNLETCFGFKIIREKQLIKCLVISRASNSLTVYQSGDRIFNISNTGMDMNKVSLQEILDYLQAAHGVYAYFPYPIIDETNFNGKLGRITFDGDVNDFRKVGDELEKHGIAFSIQDREVEIMVINGDK